MKWTVVENEEGICSGLTIEDLPTVVPANIHIINKGGKLGIKSENIAGVLPCKNGHEIVIEPKYNSIKPLELMMYINNISGIAINRERLQSGDQEIDIHSLADAFVHQLMLIRSSSKKFVRTPKTIVSDSVTGKVNWLKTYRKQHNGSIGDIITTIRTANYDIGENIIIAEASKKIIALYPYSSESYDVLLPWVKLADKFKYSLKELYSISNKLNEKTLSGSHAFYYAPVMLAKIILGFDGVELKEEQDDTILFNMPGLYEEYIRTGFQRTGGKHGCTIQKGLTPRSFLFFNGECEMIPDIVIYDGNRIKALMDVKYKKPDSKDYYQIFAYMKYAKVDRAFIISPDVPDKQIITSFDGTKICYIRVDNSKHDYLENVVDEVIRDIM